MIPVIRVLKREEEFENQSKKCMAFLVNREHPPKDIIKNFNEVKQISRQEARIKKIPSKEKKHRFFTEFNPNAPNISEILKKHDHLIRGHEKLNKIFPQQSFQVVNRRTKNLQELILRADPYSISFNETNFRYNKCGQCDSCKNFVVGNNSIKSKATGKVFRLRKNLDCSSRNVIYVAECKNCKMQGVGSTTAWKPRLRNYKSHINNGHDTCRIVKHFREVCINSANPVEYLNFHIIDSVNNTDGLSSEQIDELLLNKEKRWIRNLVTCHKGMNSTHDLNRTKRNEREKMH